MLLEVQNLTYQYPDQTQALQEVSFAISAGERVGLIGPNGAGKSTLLWHLNGLLPEVHPRRNGQPTGAGQGSTNWQGVRVDSLPMTEEHLPSIRRLVGLVFQDPDDQLFCPTVREDVAFGPLNQGLARPQVDQQVAQALQQVELTGYEHRQPHHLSIGERKRVCLAGVLACRPKLLALDEPTANLDPRGRRNLLGILQRLDSALLIASHDLEMILTLAPRVILLDNGRIHADGPTQEILADETLMLKHGLERPLSLSR